MLCREVCIKCWETYDPGMKLMMLAIPEWGSYKLFCPYSRQDTRHMEGRWTFVGDPPPKWCDFKFEHAISEAKVSK